MDENILTGLEKRQLGELARAILAELGRAETAAAAPAHRDDGTGFQAEYSFLAAEAPSRKRAERDADGYEKSKHGSESDDETAPRRQRSEFLEQRLQRRNKRAPVSGTTGEFAGGTAYTDSAETPGVCLRDTTERISELVCRDARRYDGGFEKF